MKPADTGFEPLAEERPGIFGRMARLNWCLLVLLIIPAAYKAWRPPYAELERKKEAVKKLETRKDELLVDVARKREKLGLIKSDGDYLEVVARDLLEAQKDGETIVFFRKK